MREYRQVSHVARQDMTPEFAHQTTFIDSSFDEWYVPEENIFT
jgi:hypothetical protein